MESPNCILDLTLDKLISCVDINKSSYYCSVTRVESEIPVSKQQRQRKIS